MQFLMILCKTILVRKGVKRRKNKVNADYRNGYCQLPTQEMGGKLAY